MDSTSTYLLIQNQHLLRIISKLLLLEYYKFKYKKLLKSINRRNGKTIPKHISCPRCDAPHQYIYDNNRNKSQFQCKVCSQVFNEVNHAAKPIVLLCPHCNHTLEVKKDRKHFRIHKCIHKNCSYYLRNLRKLPKGLSPHEKSNYKLHYIYREFTVDFFKMDLHELPSRATSFNFKKFNPHVLGLVLTYHVNLKLSPRQTAHALRQVHGINLSHTTVANYTLTAAAVIKPFVDSFDYNPSHQLFADETGCSQRY